MNIYQKLSEARVLFQSRGVKMSGNNKFAGYSYYELGDILPAINVIAKELGFTCLVSFGDIATLTVVNTEKPDELVIFTSPMSTAALKGCHEVQNLGAVETYIKRYLYQNAFEIVENDAVNGMHNPDEKPAKPDGKTLAGKKSALIDWLQADPPVFTDAQRKYAEDAIASNNIVAMDKAIDGAKKKAEEAKV